MFSGSCLRREEGFIFIWVFGRLGGYLFKCLEIYSFRNIVGFRCFWGNCEYILSLNEIKYFILF